MNIPDSLKSKINLQSKKLKIGETVYITLELYTKDGTPINEDISDIIFIKDGKDKLKLSYVKDNIFSLVYAPRIGGIHLLRLYYIMQDINISYPVEIDIYMYVIITASFKTVNHNGMGLKTHIDDFSLHFFEDELLNKEVYPNLMTKTIDYDISTGVGNIEIIPFAKTMEGNYFLNLSNKDFSINLPPVPIEIKDYQIIYTEEKSFFEISKKIFTEDFDEATINFKTVNKENHGISTTLDKFSILVAKYINDNEDDYVIIDPPFEAKLNFYNALTGDGEGKLSLPSVEKNGKYRLILNNEDFKINLFTEIFIESKKKDNTIDHRYSTFTISPSTIRKSNEKNNV